MKTPKKRTIRLLIAAVVAVVSVGAGVSATTADDAPEEAGHLTNVTSPTLHSFGIRW